MASRLVWLKFSIHSRLSILDMHYGSVISLHDDYNSESRGRRTLKITYILHCHTPIRNSEIMAVYDLIVGNSASLWFNTYYLLWNSKLKSLNLEYLTKINKMLNLSLLSSIVPTIVTAVLSMSDLVAHHRIESEKEKKTIILIRFFRGEFKCVIAKNGEIWPRNPRRMLPFSTRQNWQKRWNFTDVRSLKQRSRNILVPDKKGCASRDDNLFFTFSLFSILAFILIF